MNNEEIVLLAKLSSGKFYCKVHVEFGSIFSRVEFIATYCVNYKTREVTLIRCNNPLFENGSSYADVPELEEVVLKGKGTYDDWNFTFIEMVEQ